MIPAGLARVPGRRPSGLPVPCEASPAGGAAAARPAVDGPRSAGSLPLPARRRSFLSRSSSGRPAAVLPGPSSRGGSRARTGPGAVAGCLGGRAARRAGGSCGLKGVPAAAAVAARLAWSLGGVCGGKDAPRGVEEKEALVAVAHAGPWGLLAEGASARGPVRPRRPLGRRASGESCRGAKVGAWALSRTRVRVPVWRWGLRSVSLPLAAPRPGLPSDAGSAPLSPPSRGQSRSSTSSPPPPPVRARASPPRVRRWARPHPPLLAGGRPPSGLPPLPVGVVSLPPVHGPPTPPEGVGGGFPVSPALRLACPCALGVGPLRPPPAREPRPHPPARPRPVWSAAWASCWERVVLAASRYGCVAGFRRVAFPVLPPPSPARPSRAPLPALRGVRSFPRVDRRRSLLSPPPSALVLPLAPRPVRPARPGSSRCRGGGVGEVGGGRERRKGKKGFAVVAVVSGEEAARRSWDRRGGRGALSCDGVPLRARGRVPDPSFGGVPGRSRLPFARPARPRSPSPPARAPPAPFPGGPPLTRAPTLPPSLPLALSLSLSRLPPRLGFARAPYLVDPASSICLSQRLSHACLSTHGRYSETANGSLNQLWFLWSLAPLLLG